MLECDLLGRSRPSASVLLWRQGSGQSGDNRTLIQADPRGSGVRLHVTCRHFPRRRETMNSQKRFMQSILEGDVPNVWNRFRDANQPFFKSALPVYKGIRGLIDGMTCPR